MSLSTHVMRSPPRHFSLRGAVLAAIVAAIALASISGARAQAGQPRFALNASGASVTCDKASEPTECDVGLGASFTLSIELLDPPAAGYLAVQTQLYLDGLTWTPASVQEENVWPDNQLPVRSPDAPGPGVVAVSHGGLTALSRPFPLSHYEGAVVELQMSCSADPASFSPSLIAQNPAVAPLGTTLVLEDNSFVPPPTIGTADIDANNDGVAREVPVAYILGIKCGQSAPEPDGPPGLDIGNFPSQAPETLTPVGGTQAPDQQTTPGRNNTPNATAGDETPATPGPSDGGEDDDDDGGGAPWAIIGVVIGAVVVAGAGGAYLWYLRRSRSQT